MELQLEVVLSSSIKRKKPWPRFCWLGQEKESVFLLDDKRISEINMVSGRTKKRTPKLHPLLNNVLTMASSHCGTWLCGVLVAGELFLWNKDRDLLKTVGAAPEVVDIIASSQGNTGRLSVQVSGDATRLLLVASTGQVFLWECVDVRDLTGLRDGTVKGCWARIEPAEGTILPSLHDKEASRHTVFVKTEALGDVCLLALVFVSGQKLILSCLKVQWEERHMRVGSVGYSAQWATKTFPLSDLNPPCRPVKSRGALVPAFSPDGQLLAIILNQKQPKATQVLYVSTQNFVSVSSSLGGCGVKAKEVPSKYIRSYWVSSVSWSTNSLFLACVLKRGSLLMLARLGRLITLTSSGCSVDFGPAQFLPLHPLVTYRPPFSAGKVDASLSSSSLSVRDVMRQRYSVTWHPRLLYLIVSDGYMATVMRVLHRPSPVTLLKMLLKDTTADLEKLSEKLCKSQVQVRSWLDSVSCLNLESSLEALNSTSRPSNSTISAGTDVCTLPLFLQDLWASGGTTGLLEKVQSFLEDDSDFDGPPAGSHVEEGGRLEFASMFDTLHAQDTNTAAGPATWTDDSVEEEGKIHPFHRDVGKIQSRLLTVWAVSVSLGGAVEHRAALVKHTLLCLVRVAALVHLIPSYMVSAGRAAKVAASSHVLRQVRALLSFLAWDKTRRDGPCCLGLVVEFTDRLVTLLLTPYNESYRSGQYQPSAQSLSRTLQVLQLVSCELDKAYGLQQRHVWSSEDQRPLCQPSDVHHIPLLQEEKEKEVVSLCEAQPVPQRPSSRLFAVWQRVYDVTRQYLEKLSVFDGYDGWEEEQRQCVFIMSQIQTALQTTGERLEEEPALLSYTGEHLYLCGLYQQSADVWKSQLCDKSNKLSGRKVFQETRACLALLYSFLSQYRLREAQELGDHMAALLLHRCGHVKDNVHMADSSPCSWLPSDLHCEAACAVVQSLGRFMASYFSNQALHILPPHHVAVLPPLHLPHAPTVGRLVPLHQQEVASAVRRHHLSEVWTVDYALDLLLLGGLLPEAVWLASHLGDWKTAVSLSLAFSSCSRSHLDFSKLRSRDLHLPKALRVKHMFQAQLRRLLGNKLDARDQRDEDDEKSLSDPLDGLDWDLLLVSVQEILKASVMAAVDVITSPLSSLLDTAKDLSCCLPLLVPSGLYLPSPPLYCPQPSPNTQDPVGTPGHLAEVAARHKVSGVIQKLLLLLRSARCCRPAAQWYITHLRRARHVLFKIRKKYSYPGAAEEEEPFHEGLMKFVARHGFFRWRPNKDSRLDPDVVRTIICFRELCALCWMLHVRDQLSLTCRKYQAARQNPGDSEVTSCCAEALRWACRFLPFARFLDAEEILQDVLLSLVAELPPVSLVAEMLVRCFPEEGESVRVSLREKYNSLTQRLRHSTVLGTNPGTNPEGANGENESMMVLVQDEYRQRRKHLGRLRRHLAPPQLHLWEKEDEEEERRGGERGSAAMLGQLSLGTSLSTSTLNDCGFPPVCSDAENTSEAVSPDQQGRPSSSEKNDRNIKHKQQPDGMQSSAQKDGHRPDTEENKETSLPAVGSWEFELEDEEYLNFLELFLSYELEKDGADGADGASELPLLKSFSSKLKERELHSLTFDVLTTVHRRQRDVQLTGRRQWSSHPPVFRAGHCYRPVTSAEPSTPSIWNKTQNPRISRSLSLSSVPGQKNSRQEGLFGLRRQNSLSSVQNTSAGHVSFDTSAFPISRHPEGLGLGSSTSPEAVVELQQCLDPRLEAEFPALGRLLEWMVRWADRRVLLGQHGNKGKGGGGGGGGGGPENEGIVIRVKASAPAILTALSLLQWRYSVVPGGGSHAHVPSVLLTEVDRKLDQESSVDTGYPGSTHTPVTAPERHLQQEKLSSGSSTDETEEQEQEHHRVPLHVRIHRRRSPQPPPSQSDLEEVTAGEEEESADARGRLDVSSPDLNQNNSENICAPDESLKVADLDASDKQQPSITDSLNLQPPAPPPPPPPQPKPRVIPAAQPQVTDSVGAEFPLTPVDPPELHPQSSTPAAAAPPSQPLNQSSNMRQQLGQDLFRLVQNINYMNMMEVLGASFANLQLAQQNSLTQSNIVPSFHGPNINAVPRPNTSHVQPTQTFTAQSQITRHETPTSTAAADHHQEMRPLSVHVESPEIHFGLSRKLIPSSQGLLTTTDTRKADAPALGAQSFGSHVQNENADSVLGKKHQRHCAQLPQQIAPKCPPVQEPKLLFLENSNVSQEPKTSSRREEEDKRKTRTSALKRQLSFDLPFDSVSRNPQRQLHSSEKSRGQEFTLLPPAQKPAAPPQGLQLLRFQSVTHDDVAFPKIPVLFSFKPPAVVPAPVQETPLIKLSFKDPGLQNMFPVASSSSMPMTRLMSVDQLRSSVTSRQKSGDAQMQLLKVDPPPTAPAADVAAAASSGFNSSKRQKRREGKAVSERKAEVTFRPNDSIIPTEEVKEEESVNGVKVESAAAQEVVQGINFAFPLGSFDYLLSGQSLSDAALPTSAELHAFAATRKTPTECQDAFTNTDSGCPPTLQDKSVSTSLTFISPEAPTTQEVLKVRDGNVTEDAREGDETFLDTRCYRLIRIEDLEDAARHQDLLSRLGPETQHVSSVQSSASASANVHILETPVIEAVAAVAAAPAAAPGGGVGSLQSEAGAETPLLTTSHRGEDSNMNRHLQSSTDFTRDVWEPLDSRICRAIKSVSVGAHRVSSSPPSVWFSARMSELDAQLAALQRIADCLEEDFSNSRMLVNTIENLCPVTAPDVKRNVRLSVPQEALMRPSNTLEDEKENRGNKPGLLGDPRTPQEKSQFLRCSSPYSSRAGPSHLHSPPTKERDYLTEVSGISLGSEDEHLAPSGLSDTAELLEKLVDEGYLSPSDLDWSNLQTHSRLHQSQRNNRSQKNVRTEDERRELRIWMRRKQRERLAVYQKHRESLREREKKPFCPSGKAPSAGRPRASGLGGKKEREIAALLKQHKQRALEACSLVGSFSTPPPDTLSLPLENTYSIYRTPASDKRVLKSNLGQTLTMEHGRRTEPHRPVTSSPKTHVLTTRQSQERHDSYQMRSGGRGVQRTEYGDEVKRLEPISEVNSLVDQEEPEFNLDDAPHIGGSGMDWLENLSQNTGSTLSKIDWAAVERMVAAVED